MDRFLSALQRRGRLLMIESGLNDHTEPDRVMNDGSGNPTGISRRMTLQRLGLLAGAALVTPPSLARTRHDDGTAPPGTIDLVPVAAQPGRFMGWPANNGCWNWDQGREILVGFEEGPWVDQPGHKIGEPQHKRLARSLDGGRSWRVESPEPFVGREPPPRYPARGVAFTHPDFALRVAVGGSRDPRDRVGRFFVSYDRGRRWKGPYRFPGLGEDPRLRGLVMSSRTDIVVTGEDSAILVMSAIDPRLGEFSDRLDKPFVARTLDRGRSFQFVSWVVPWSDPYRAVMPSTVALPGPERLVTTLRRRNPREQDQPNWVDAYASEDGGASWTFLSRVGETGLGNGNPPSLVLLPEGRLACAYGNRGVGRMNLRISDDGGRRWGEERPIGEIPLSWDFGYPQMVLNHRGELVVMYYLATNKMPYSYIEAAVVKLAEPARFGGRP